MSRCTCLWAKSKKPQTLAHSGFWLTDQGSNLDSSEPKSDVLPVTPSVNWERKSKKLSFMIAVFSTLILLFN